MVGILQEILNRHEHEEQATARIFATFYSTNGNARIGSHFSYS
jgi:hypothetical protein